MKIPEQVQRLFWLIGDVLRGTTLSADAISEVRPVLFFVKRFLDQNAVSIDVVAVAGRSDALPALTSWGSIKMLPSSAEGLLAALRGVERALPMLAGLSDHTRLAHELKAARGHEKMWDEILGLLGSEDFSRLSDELAAAIFQWLLDEMPVKAPTAVTPPVVRQLFVGAVNPGPGASIYDPVCGFGSLLRESASHVAKSIGRHEPPSLFGQELFANVALVAKMNLLIVGQNPNIRVGNTLLKPEFTDGSKIAKFDYVLANPPFGTCFDSKEILEKDEFARFRPVASNSFDLLFIQHVVASLSDSGRAAVLVSPGALFRSGNGQVIREKLVAEDLIEAVVTLPQNIFQGTTIAAAILVLAKRKSANLRGKILFVDLTSAWEGSRTRRVLTFEGVTAAIKCMREPTDIPGFSRLVDHAEIQSNDHNLTIQRYVRARQMQDGLSFAEEMERFEHALSERERSENEALTLLHAYSESAPREHAKSRTIQ